MLLPPDAPEQRTRYISLYREVRNTTGGESKYGEN
jgi:hypothetical protein